MPVPMQHELIVEIGPFQEWEGKNEPGSLKIVSNGDINSMKIKVHVEKTKIYIPNLARISIWNLKRSTIDSLKTAGKEVRVYAGIQGYEKEYLYKGSLMGVVTERQGTDYVTTLTCQTSGSNLIRSVVSKTWTEGVAVDQVVREIVATIPNVTYDPLNNTIKGTIGYKGFSFVGTASTALTKLGNQFGFSWNINNGVFVVTMDGTPRRTGIVLNSRSGLRKVSPRLSGILQIQDGVDIYCVYQQNIEPGQLIRVESSVSPKLNGSYEAHTIEYDLCPKEDEWDMSISFFSYIGGA